MAFELTTRPVAEIRWGMLSPDSKDKIQDWMIQNMRRFLREEMQLSVPFLVPKDKDIQTFCKELFDEIHQVGYEEGYDSAQCDNEGEGL